MRVLRQGAGLKERIERYSLKINEEKTQLISFSRAQARKGVKQGTFDFLGFTFYIGKSRRGFYIPKVKSSGRRIRKKLQIVKEWCRTNRHRGTMCELWGRFCTKLRGHAGYFAVSGNFKAVVKFFYHARRIFFKWINRRSQRGSIRWNGFNRFIVNYPLPRIRIIHKLY